MHANSVNVLQNTASPPCDHELVSLDAAFPTMVQIQLITKSAKKLLSRRKLALRNGTPKGGYF